MFLTRKIQMFRTFLFVTTSLLFLGCAQFKTRDEVGRRAQGPVVVTVPGASGSADEDTTSVVTPAPTVAVGTVNARVALVLGPGGFRALAHAQVLKELVQAKIPIEKVVGLEWGALAGAFYSLDGKAHEAEWRLYKLDSKQLESRGFFNLKSSSSQPVKDLSGYLSENLGRRDLKSLKVKFSCPQFFLKTGVVSWADRGSVNQIVENCLAYPPRWAPARGAVAAALSTNEAVEKLRREGYNIIILVNVLPDGELLSGAANDPDRMAQEILWEEARRNIWLAKSRATDVIEIKSKGGLFDLSSRKAFAQQAEKIAKDAAQRVVNKYGF